MLALKNKRKALVNLLLRNEQLCLGLASLKYGTALHVALTNLDFKNAQKILRLLRQQKDFEPATDLNKVDHEGNTPLHLVMKYFNHDLYKSTRLTKTLLKHGGDLTQKNRQNITPLCQACSCGQSEAVRFAAAHNLKQKRSKRTG